MDRLVCGDVGFGKTEIAVRAAFKAAVNGKQVAILVPTTILAAQHYRSFSERLKDFPVTVEYVNRFRSTGTVKEVLRKLKEGKVDILIGTHRIVGKDVEFKDLGLLIIDEEQKFGVGVKDKLKNIKKNVDTLTLTATPIPRTLQFSMMGARDLSVINTPPPNRQPVETEVHTFNEEIFSDAISYEIARDGQVFVVNNRVANLEQIADMIRNLLLTFGLILSSGIMLFAQQGALKGKVIDKETKEPIPFANIVLENNGTMTGGATSDFDGNYQIKPIPPGKYSLKATYIGYKTVIVNGMAISADKTRFYDIEMTPTSETLEEVEIVDYTVPLISKDETSSGASVTS